MDFVQKVYQREEVINAEILVSQAKPDLVVIDFLQDQFISADWNYTL